MGTLRIFLPTGRGKKGVDKERIEIVYQMLCHMGHFVTKGYGPVMFIDPNGPTSFGFTWTRNIFGMIICAEVPNLEEKQTIMMDLGYIVVGEDRKVLQPVGV